MREKKKLAILEQTTLPRILVLLLGKQKASRTDLRNSVDGSQAAIYNAIELLSQNGLIVESMPKGSARRIDITLTPKGRHIAEILEKVEELL